MAGVSHLRLRWIVLGLLVVVFLVPAAMLTVARVVQPMSGAWVRLVSFTPYAVPLYAVAALLLVLPWLRGRGAWRATSRLLVVTALLGVAVHAYWASGPYLGTTTAAQGDARLHVMTSNLLRGQANTSRVVEVAVDRDVDVLVLQEITSQALSRLRAAGIDKAFAHSAGKAEPGTHGTMVFSSRPLRGVRRLDTGLGGFVMQVSLADRSVDLLAVHPLPPIGDALAWRADHRVLRQAARGLDGPAMIVGDLNATMDHQPMRELVGRGYDDAATQARSRWQPTWPASGEVSRLGFDVPSLVAIDHVLVKGDLRAIGTESVTIEGSDHRALLALLAL